MKLKLIFIIAVMSSAVYGRAQNSLSFFLNGKEEVMTSTYSYHVMEIETYGTVAGSASTNSKMYMDNYVGFQVLQDQNNFIAFLDSSIADNLAQVQLYAQAVQRDLNYIAEKNAVRKYSDPYNPIEDSTYYGYYNDYSWEQNLSQQVINANNYLAFQKGNLYANNSMSIYLSNGQALHIIANAEFNDFVVNYMNFGSGYNDNYTQLNYNNAKGQFVMFKSK